MVWPVIDLRMVLSYFFTERNFVMLFAPKERGQGHVEYAMILVFVAVLVIAIVRLLSPKLGNTFSTISSSLL